MVGLNPENRKHATLDYGPSMPEGMRFVEAVVSSNSVLASFSVSILPR